MATTANLPAALKAAVEKETRGEAIRWIGRPRPTSAFAHAAPIWAMGIPWSALTFSIFGVLLLAIFAGKPPKRIIPVWEYWAMGAAVVFAGSFALIGAAMLLSPFHAAWTARRTAHIITDRRLITLTSGRSTSVRSFGPAEVLLIERRQHADGSGTLHVVTGFKRDSDGDKIEQRETLVGVADVAKAEVLLRSLRSERRVA
ncbi:MAG TPA: hypothetical protein PK264_11680 [Hyphomicrobiaceae bacterium]|nr:hypothetical protein [Hyphomicrobiaceae bacterium]